MREDAVQFSMGATAMLTLIDYTNSWVMAAGLIALLTIWQVSVAFYNARMHPLASFPGPLLARCSLVSPSHAKLYTDCHVNDICTVVEILAFNDRSSAQID